MPELKQLSFCTFNLLNLNLPGKPIYQQDGWTNEQYTKKANWTASQLKTLAADVFGFQELWHGDAIKDAFTRAELHEQYDLLVPDDTSGQRIVCAAAVRKGLLADAPEWIEDFPGQFQLSSRGTDPQTPRIAVNIEGFSRPVLRFQIKPRSADPAIWVYVCHFKSKGPTEIYIEAWYEKDVHAKHGKAIGAAISTIRRTAESTALRILLTEQLKNNDIPAVIMGDMNDGQHSNTANILTEQPRYLVGDTPGGGDLALYTAQTLQEYRDTRDVYYTYVHQGLRESLDHIFVTQEFYDNSKKRTWLFKELVILNDHLNFLDKKSAGTNDHGIIMATFQYKPVQKI